MILTRSPYYISAPVTLGTTTAVTLNLKVQTGTADNSLSNLDYTITKNRPQAGTTYLDFEISNMLRDKFEYVPPFSPTFGILNSDPANILSLNYSLDYIGSAGDTQVFQQLVLDGYGYFQERINPDIPDNKILLANDYYYVNANGFFCIPFINDGTYSNVIVDGTPYSQTPSTNITSKLKYVWFNLNQFNDTVIVQIGGNTITLQKQEECKHTPVDVIFHNKYGAWEIFTFYKTKKESVSITKESFKNNFVKNGNYDEFKHTYQDYNKNGRESLKLSSGFLPESYNETVRQLLLSEHVFLVNGGNPIPVNVETSSYSWKSRIIDKLINHEIEFKYSFDLINNI
ncbi:hypothetical protein [Flagellimonas onchidii]|uniref:hypothetical protein n=1 Tax=Flagellimonas onchidii TaxID=2562684 RepID=UPI0010A5A72C|nr:hypothetical protein [Allomuricauda onchidii]